MGNVHKSLTDIGYQIVFSGITVLSPGRRYIGVQYSQPMRAALGVLEGEQKWVEWLANNDDDPAAISQFFPAMERREWFFAIYRCELKVILAQAGAQEGTEIRAFWRSVKKQDFANDLNNALWYVKSVEGGFEKNPFCSNLIGGFGNAWSEIGESSPKFVTPSEFIADGQTGYKLWPAIEPMRAGPWPVYDERKAYERALEDAKVRARNEAFAQANMLGDQPTVYTTAAQQFWGTRAAGQEYRFNFTGFRTEPPTAPLPPEPEFKAKNGRMIVRPDEAEGE